MCPVTQYYIPKHVHFASEGDTVIFLDLRSDQYSMLLGRKAHAFNAMLSNTRVLSHDVVCLDKPQSTFSQDYSLRESVLSELLESRLLQCDNDLGDVPRPTDISLPERSLIEPRAAGFARISIADIRRFLVACVASRLLLKFASIESIIRRVELRKAKRHPQEPASLLELRRVVTIYNRLRPMVPWNYLCLFDSLCLLEFLARYRHFPTWVFAVRLDPWAAHCWVQYDATALNEDIDVAREYLPIMAI